MNVRYELTLLISVIFIVFLPGCVKDSPDNCISFPQGIDATFYSLSPCQTDTVYPVDVTDLTIGVFDKEGVLVSFKRSTNVELNKEYVQSMELEGGLYTVIAWSGVNDEAYDINQLENGVTTKKDLYFRLKRAANVTYSIEGSRVYYGESPAVYVEESKQTEMPFEKASVNLQEITNRFTITLEGVVPGNLEILIESDNTSMDVNGMVAPDDILIYEPTYANTSNRLVAHFTTLKLETGQTNTIIIRDREEGTELYRGNLLGTLLLKNPEVNLACDHDFVINFTAEDQCDCGAYIILRILVNNWLVHSYQTQV